MTKRGIYLIIASTIAVGFATYGIVIYVRNKKEIKNQDKIIETKEDETGTAVDMEQSKAFDVNYYKTKEAAKKKMALLSDEEAKRIADQIWQAVDDFPWPGREDKIIAAFNKLENPAQVSQVANVFNDDHEQDMFTALDDEWGLNMDRIDNIITKLNKRYGI